MQNPNDDVIIEEDANDNVIVDGQNESGDSSTPEQNNDVNVDIDEKGVSYKNRFYEVNRKLEHLQKSIPDMIREAAEVAAKSTSSQVARQQEYSVQDYLTAKQKDPVNAPFYDAKILELQKAEVSQTVKSELSNFQRQQKEELARQQANNWAYQNFPQLSNPEDQLTRLAMQYYQGRPEDKRLPEDFAIAVELAANRLGVKPTLAVSKPQEKVEQLNRTVKKLSKERILEGDGRARTEVNKVTDRQKDMQQALASGNFKDYIQKHLLKAKEED